MLLWFFFKYVIIGYIFLSIIIYDTVCMNLANVCAYTLNAFTICIVLLNVRVCTL